MFKLFVLTLLCAAVLAQSEPSTNNGQESKSGESWGDRLNHIKEHVKEDMERIKEHVKEDMERIKNHITKHMEEHRQHQPSPTTPNPTGTSTPTGTSISS